MQKFIQIKKGMSVVKTKEGTEVKLPSRASKGMRNYRYDVERQILQKKCTKCKTYFDMDQIIDGTFVDIHDDTLIKDHNGKSEMSSRCVECAVELKVSQVKEAAEKLGIKLAPLNDVLHEVAREEQSSQSKSDAIRLTKENLKYIAHVAIVNDLSIDEQINKEVERLRKVNPLRIDYQEKVK